MYQLFDLAVENLLYSINIQVSTVVEAQSISLFIEPRNDLFNTFSFQT